MANIADFIHIHKGKDEKEEETSKKESKFPSIVHRRLGVGPWEGYKLDSALILKIKMGFPAGYLLLSWANTVVFSF